MLLNEFDVFYRINFVLIKYPALSFNNEAFCVVFSPIRCYADFIVVEGEGEFMTFDGDIVSINTFRI